MLGARPATVRTAATGAGLLLLAGVLALGAWYVPHALRGIRSLDQAKDRVAAEGELAKTVLQAVGGAVVLAGLYFTWRTLALSQQGQITGRFNDAVEHLGSDALAVRLGGVYALARIAADSERDAATIVEILCSFVRDAAVPGEDRTAADVRAVLRVLGTAAWAREAAKDLRGCVFLGLDAERLDLRNSDLEGAEFRHCRLAETRFDGSNLRAASFVEAYARGCSFVGCDVAAAKFEGAYLRKANFDRAELFGATLRNASLPGASFRGARHGVRQQFAEAVIDETTVLPDFVALESGGDTQAA